MCNKGQEKRGMGGGEFKKRIISLKKRCFNSHQWKEMFHLQRPKGLSAPLQDFSQTSPGKKKKGRGSKNKITEKK